MRDVDPLQKAVWRRIRSGLLFQRCASGHRVVVAGDDHGLGMHLIQRHHVRFRPGDERTKDGGFIFKRIERDIAGKHTGASLPLPP